MFLPNVVGTHRKGPWSNAPVYPYDFPALSIGTSVFTKIATETIVYRERFTDFNVFQCLKPDKTHSKSEELKYRHRRGP